MYVDAQNQFDAATQHLTTEASTNIIDLGSPRNIGVGENLYFVAIVVVAFTDAGSDSTMTLALQTDDNAGFASPLTAQTIGTFGALAAAGSRLVARLQPDTINERFLRVGYTVANGNLTTGSFTTFLTHDIQAFTAYPDAITIS